MNSDEGKVWFQCQRCTACCKWPGDVKVENDEIERIAAFLGVDVPAFIERFTRLRTNRQGLSIIEKPNHECLFLVDGGCVINPVKPRQCAGFPNTWNFPGWRKVCEAKPIPWNERPKEEKSVL